MVRIRIPDGSEMRGQREQPAEMRRGDEKLSRAYRAGRSRGGFRDSDLSWLAPLAASSRHPAGEAAARHGAASRSGEDPETAEPRA